MGIHGWMNESPTPSLLVFVLAFRLHNSRIQKRLPSIPSVMSTRAAPPGCEGSPSSINARSRCPSPTPSTTKAGLDHCFYLSHSFYSPSPPLLETPKLQSPRCRIHRSIPSIVSLSMLLRQYSPFLPNHLP